MTRFRDFWQWLTHWIDRDMEDEELQKVRDMDEMIGPTGDEPLDDRPFDPSRWYEPPKGRGP